MSEAVGVPIALLGWHRALLGGEGRAIVGRAVLWLASGAPGLGGEGRAMVGIGRSCTLILEVARSNKYKLLLNFVGESRILPVT